MGTRPEADGLSLSPFPIGKEPYNLRLSLALFVGYGLGVRVQSHSGGSMPEQFLHHLNISAGGAQ